MLRHVKNIGFVLVILGHYYFCGYVLSEVHNLKNYEPNRVDFKEDKVLEEDVSVENRNLSTFRNKERNLGIIEIPKINLRRYLYDVKSIQNNVNKNIEILENSDMPDVLKGNFILAGHNGNTGAGHFRNLYKLALGDEVIVFYNNKKYVYEVLNIYDVLKTGKVMIKRDKSKSTITLITCLGNDRQLVVIGYLKE